MAHYISVLIYLSALILVTASATQAGGLTEADIVVSPGGEVSSISEALRAANEGDVIRVEKGTYKEHINISIPLTILGVDHPSIDGGGKDTVVVISAPGTVFKGFHITGSGTSLNLEHGGIIVDSAEGTVIEDNKLTDVLFGIYLKNSPKSLIKNNVIHGKALPLPQRGDGIRLWYSSETKILGNHVLNARDLVMWWSGNTLIKGNRIERGRYGLHYMYSDNNVFDDNVFIDNYVGGFLMYSKNIKFVNNIFARNQGPATGYGVGFKDLDDIVAVGNLFIDNRIGLYLDNSPHLIDSWNLIKNNVIAFNDIGASFMPSIERNKLISNQFIDNTEQIEVRGGGTLKGNKWSDNNKGNHWSDYVGYDENKDGIGDMAYKSESLFENIIDSNPALRIFIHSPVSQAIELASDAFPVMKPEPKVKDDFPLMTASIPDKFVTDNKGLSPKLLAVSLVMILTPILFYAHILNRNRRPHID